MADDKIKLKGKWQIGKALQIDKLVDTKIYSSSH